MGKRELINSRYERFFLDWYFIIEISRLVILRISEGMYKGLDLNYLYVNDSVFILFVIIFYKFIKKFFFY